jgi:hypothetical protein
MAVSQGVGKNILSKFMSPGVWYEVQDLIVLFEAKYDAFDEEDITPIKSEPNRPRWHRRITNCVRMSPGRHDYHTDNSWVELRTRKTSGRKYEYSLAIADPIEVHIVEASGDDDGTGFIYAIANDSFGSDWIKIGKTIDLVQRLSAYQVYTPFHNYRVVGSVAVFDRHTAECVAHRYASDRTETTPSGEWFNIGENDALEVLHTVHRRYRY